MYKRDAWTSKASTVHHQLQSDGQRVNYFLCVRLSLNPSTKASVLWLLNPGLNIKPPGCVPVQQDETDIKMKCKIHEPVVPVVIFCTFIPQELEAIKARVMEMEEEEEEKLREAQYCSDKPCPYGPLQTGNHGQPNPSAPSHHCSDPGTTSLPCWFWLRKVLPFFPPFLHNFLQVQGYKNFLSETLSFKRICIKR